MQTGTPETWVSVRTVTLVDLSTAALTRAKECAEMLFPCAEVKTIQCDLKNSTAITTVYETFHNRNPVDPRNPFVPHIHFLSNILDLLDNSFIEAFYNKIQNDTHFNECLIAFSPSYGEVQNRPFENLNRACQLKFEEGAEIKARISRKTKTGWLFFCRLLNKKISKYEEAARKEPLLASLLDCAVSEYLWGQHYEDYAALWDYCEREDRTILSKYCALKLFPIPDGTGGTQYDFFLLCPRKQDEPFRIIHSPKLFRGDPCRDKCLQESCNRQRATSTSFCPKLRVSLYHRAEELIAKEAKIEDFKTLKAHIHWAIRRPNEQEQQRPKTLQSDKEIQTNLLSLFFTNAWKDVNPLPEPQKPVKTSGKNQWDVIYSLRQLRVVRGGPGVGKTFALLWHALYAYKRTHLPVLIVGKTNTLQSINARILDVTLSKYLHQIQKRTEAFTVETANEFLCHLQYPRYRQDNHPFRCDQSSENCAQCNQEVYEHPEKYALNKTYGCVLVDEAQALMPEEVNAIYTITKANNSWREFYLFCDEQQSLRKTNNLTRDASTGLRKLKVPDVGFGRSTILKENHRLKNHTLLRVCEKIREQMATRYDTKELTMTLADDSNTKAMSSGLLFRSFAITRCPPVFYNSKDNNIASNDDLSSSLKASFKELMTLEYEERNTLLCLCNAAKIAASLSQESIQKKLLSWSSLHNVKITHLPDSIKETKNLHREHKALRRAFYESDDTLHITTIDCAQGHTFEKVCLVLSNEFDLTYLGNLELLFTACSRARTALRVIDATSKHEVYELLKQFN